MARGLTCTHCGARLRIPENEKVVTCEYCGTDNAVDEVADPPYTTPRDQAPPRIEATHSTSSPAPRMIVLILVPVVLVLGAVVAFLVGPLRQSGSLGGRPVYGDAKGMLRPDVVVPSWDALDGLETVRNVRTSVPPGWKLSTIRWNRTRPDGTIDLENDDEASVSILFYDPTRLENVVPGETSAAQAQYNVNLMDGYVTGSIGDATLAWADDILYVASLPTCDLATLREKAASAGYPAEGFANVTFPEVPYELTRERMEWNLSYVEPDGEALVEKFEDMPWDTSRFHSYSYYVNNLDAAGLPAYFDPGTCEPLDMENLVAAEIEKIRTN